jgi:ferredoxin
VTHHGVGTGRSTIRDDPAFEIKIEFQGKTTTIRATADEFLLDAAARQGLWLPRTCRQGWCTTCAARVERGSAEQSAAKRFYPADRDAGFALLCTARPQSPMTLVAGQHAAFREHRIRNGLPVPRA